MIEIRPQPGPQEMILASPADIAIIGGAAGGGKSHALLMEPLRHVSSNKRFDAVIFRRTLADAKKPGSTWDKTVEMYGPLGAKPRYDTLTWQWPHGGKVVVGHLEYDTTVLDWQSSEIALLLFDELTHFSRSQFFYMLSRNRSMSGVVPYVRASCNPDADSWVAEFIAWWIDQATGLAIPERAGVLRWFVRIDDEIIWADTRDELTEKFGDEFMPKSVTFIPAKIYDNAALMKGNPEYLANLMALPKVERERLLGGNWKIRPAAGLLFQRSWVQVVTWMPEGLDVVRYWDLAGTPKTQNNDPDWTVGLKMAGSRLGGHYFVMHALRMRDSPGKVEETIVNTAAADGRAVRIGIPQDPAAAGKAVAQAYLRKLAGYDVRAKLESGDKVTRFGPFSAQCQAGNVKVLKGPWNEAFFDTLEGFPDAAHDDDADAASGAFEMLTGGVSRTAGRQELLV